MCILAIGGIGQSAVDFGANDRRISRRNIIILAGGDCSSIIDLSLSLFLCLSSSNQLVGIPRLLLPFPLSLVLPLTTSAATSIALTKRKFVPSLPLISLG